MHRVSQGTAKGKRLSAIAKRREDGPTADAEQTDGHRGGEKEGSCGRKESQEKRQRDSKHRKRNEQRPSSYPKAAHDFTL